MKVKILYEDDAVLVIHKPAGIPVQTKKIGCMDCVSELKNYLKKSDMYSGQSGEKPGDYHSNQNQSSKNQRNKNRSDKNQSNIIQSNKNRSDKNREIPYLGIIHRLDQPVEGLMVFAKTPRAAAALSGQIASEDDSRMLKCYEAEVYGKMPATEGELTDYLIHNPADNTSSIAEGTQQNNAGAKLSRLAYRVTKENEKTQKLYIRLYTGRHHQIRVQLSHAGAPILGDQKYGTESSVRYSAENGYRMIALKAVHLEFIHPVSGRKMKWDLEETTE